jgi:hypothetical protein
MAKFKVKLIQREWITTEVFEVEADSMEQAIAEQKAFVEAEKELGEKEWKLEAEEVVELQPEDEPEA